MKKLLQTFFCLVLQLNCLSQNVAANGNGMERLAFLNELSAYSGTATTLLVTDARTGGIFYYTKDKHNVDNGIVFKGPDKGYWVRMYEESGPVDIAWFGAKMDSVTDDADALKRALAYPWLRITGNLAVSSKFVFPEGKTVEFTSAGSLTVTDTFDLKMNSFVKANDYQRIFKGTARVVLGSNSVPYASACWYGAVADCFGFKRGGGTDNTLPLQRAIYGAQKVSDLLLPGVGSVNSYRITSTVTISKKLHFFSFRFHGSGTSITYNADDRATVLFADFTDGAAINVQGSRRVILSDFCVKGVNTEPKLLASYDTVNTTPGVNNANTFLSPGVKLTYAAITTDGEKNNKVWSADVLFERIQIENFALGIGISQAGNYQGDRMRVENCQINQCVYGISVGQAQNRACHFMNVDMNRVWCGITNVVYGDHTGSVFQLTGGQWCNVYKCFNIRPSYLGQCVISGLYTEAIGMIGVVGDNNPNNSSLLFTGCYFFMQDDGLHYGYAFTPPYYTLTAFGNVTFEGCNFWAGKHYIAMFAGSVTGGYTGSAITLRGCSIHHCTSMHIKGNSIVENTYMIPISDVIDYNRSITVAFDADKRYNTGYTPVTAVSGLEVVTGNESQMTGVKDITRKIPRFYAIVAGKEHIHNVAMRHDTMTFDYDEAIGRQFFRYVLEGDQIGTTLTGSAATHFDNPAFEITSIDTNKRLVTAHALTPQLNFDTLALYTNSFFTTRPIAAVLNRGSNIATHVNMPDKLERGDFVTFAGANRAYRITAVNKADSSLKLMDAIAEPISGNTTIYNALLTDHAPESIATTAPVKLVSDDYQIQPGEHTVVAHCSGKDIQVVLPAQPANGQMLIVKKTGQSGNVIITTPDHTIDGKPNYVLKSEYQSAQLQFDGTNYILLHN